MALLPSSTKSIHLILLVLIISLARLAVTTMLAIVVAVGKMQFLPDSKEKKR